MQPDRRAAGRSRRPTDVNKYSTHVIPVQASGHLASSSEIRSSDMEGSSDKLFCCRWVRNRIPLAYREELYHILRMAGPLLLSRILQYMLPFVVTMFCGRLGNEVMAGYGLACATFGGKNLLRVGVILQRGIIILLLFCLPCWGLLINAQAILLCLGQNPEVTSGSAAANSLSLIYYCISLFAYIRWKKLHVKTWGGWTVESLQEWGSYMKLAFPSTLMTCFEWWLYEFGGFFAGAACARVGNALGAGNTARAILTCKMSFALSSFWLGLLICVILQSTFYITVIFKLNWSKMTEEYQTHTLVTLAQAGKVSRSNMALPQVLTASLETRPTLTSLPLARAKPPPRRSTMPHGTFFWATFQMSVAQPSTKPGSLVNHITTSRMKRHRTLISPKDMGPSRRCSSRITL
ncbi:Multidrug and toxin extrusion protein 1 [Liparis tanakae]|uniref:Multidrug and toxin extrusion protein 1 n=1 Tax=Liparis tanakae TaxID=230148 RepID=A0A4Z2HJY4_9TELE|nr:Multidrug and toxin extrusion protein 1 [Liparis tanakae]